jgi:putative membrane protein
MANVFLIMVILAALCTFSAASALANLPRISQDFVRNASIGGQFEIASSQLALERSRDPKLREFAERMVKDHTETGEKLNATLADTDMKKSVEPTVLDDKHQRMLDKLNATPAGSEFDKAYLQDQKDAHREAITLFGNYAKSGEDPALKEFASSTLPTLREHMNHAEHLRLPE